MTHTTPDLHEPYTPDSDRRSRARAFLTKDLSAKDVILFLFAAIIALGWRFSSPSSRIAALEVRVLAAEKEISALAEGQRFTNYMLCVNARRTDPASAPPDCAPIIEERKAK